MVVNYSSVEITGNYNPNIQQNRLALGVKISADVSMKYFPYFFLSFDNAYFLKQIYGNYHQYVVYWIFPEGGNGKQESPEGPYSLTCVIVSSIF